MILKVLELVTIELIFDYLCEDRRKDNITYRKEINM